MKRLLTTKKSHHSKRRSHTLNPFKQQDEEAVLAEKSHNRRRWSHVFPLGEIEFKRHAGPNWKSLSQPAILPLTIDYYPPPQELNTFLIRLWDIELDVEGSNYKNHTELMMEMIRQRLTQDYQVVPQSVVQESRRRDEAAAQLVIQDRRSRDNVLPSPMERGFIRPENVPLGMIIAILDVLFCLMQICSVLRCCVSPSNRSRAFAEVSKWKAEKPDWVATRK
jgi:hypothetical protein